MALKYTRLVRLGHMSGKKMLDSDEKVRALWRRLDKATGFQVSACPPWPVAPRNATKPYYG